MITDAVVPVAGLGTRLLPATKSQPKEMLPVAGKPVVQHVVEELATAHVRRVLFVTGRGKGAIEDHFDPDAELARLLRETGREDLLARLAYEQMGVEFLYTRQHAQRGLADAVACAERWVADAPFAVALGDCIIGRAGRPPRDGVVSALGEALSAAGAQAAVAVEQVPLSDVTRYGVVVPGDSPDSRWITVSGVVEKPAPSQAPSDLVVAARYAFTPAIFDAIRQTPPDSSGEVQLSDAIQALIDGGARVVAVRLSPGQRRYDAGTSESYSRTCLEFALTDPELGPGLRAAARELLGEAGPG